MLELIGGLHEATDPGELSCSLVLRLGSVIPADLASYREVDSSGATAGDQVFQPEPAAAARVIGPSIGSGTSIRYLLIS